MRIRLLAPAAAAAVLLGAVAGPAVAGTTATAASPAVGTATSALTLLSLALAGHDVRVGNVALTSDTVAGSPTSKVVVTPVRADGTAYGEQTVTPASSPASVPSFDSTATLPAALGTVASIQSPVFNVSSSNSSGASSKAGAASLGAVKVLGLPVALNGTVDVSSLVNGTNAVGDKTLVVKNLALPSIADLLGALGLNLGALPVKTLTDLLAGLNITDPAVAAAQAALDTASATIKTQVAALQSQIDSQQAQLDAAKTNLATQLKALDAAKVDLSSANAALAAAQKANTDANAAVTVATTQLASANSALSAATLLGGLIDPSLTAAVTAANTAVASTTATANTTAAALTTAQTAATAATLAVNTVQAAVDAAQALINQLTAALTALLGQLKTLLGTLGPQLNNLIAAVTSVLDKTPLVSIDSFTVQTESAVTSASAGGQTAKVVGGEIQGVHVLGTDVLANVLGNTKINVLDLAGSTLTQVTSKIDALTGVLSSVLSAVPGLAIPAPQVDLLTKSTSTSITGGFGTATDSVNALKVTIPAITLPAALALPGAASLPAITGVPNLTGALGITAVGDLLSKPISLSVGTLSESAKFRPAVVAAAPGAPAAPVATPDTAAPQLPRTGLPAGIALLGILMVGGGLVLRRRLTAEV